MDSRPTSEAGKTPATKVSPQTSVQQAPAEGRYQTRSVRPIINVIPKMSGRNLGARLHFTALQYLELSLTHPQIMLKFMVGYFRISSQQSPVSYLNNLSVLCQASNNPSLLFTEAQAIKEALLSKQDSEASKTNTLALIDQLQERALVEMARNLYVDGVLDEQSSERELTSYLSLLRQWKVAQANDELKLSVQSLAESYSSFPKQTQLLATEIYNTVLTRTS